MNWVKSIMDGYKEAKRHDWQYETIAKSPVLYSSGFLKEKADQAETKGQLECLLENMYQHDALFIRDDDGFITDVIPSYKQLEQNIIERMGF